MADARRSVTFTGGAVFLAQPENPREGDENPPDCDKNPPNAPKPPLKTPVVFQPEMHSNAE